MPTEADGLGTIRALLSYNVPVHGLEPEQRGEFHELLGAWVGTNDAEMPMKTLSSEWLKIGRAEGRAEGRADMLLRLLAKRFGTLTDSVTQRIRAAGALR